MPSNILYRPDCCYELNAYFYQYMLLYACKYINENK